MKNITEGSIRSNRLQGQWRSEASDWRDTLGSALGVSGENRHVTLKNA